MKNQFIFFYVLTSFFCFKSNCQVNTFNLDDFAIEIPGNWTKRESALKTVKLSLISKTGDNIRNVIVQKVTPNPFQASDIWSLNEEQIKTQLFFKMENETYFESYTKRQISKNKFITIFSNRKLKTKNGTYEIKTQANYTIQNNVLYCVELSSTSSFFSENSELFETILSSFKIKN